MRLSQTPRAPWLSRAGLILLLYGGLALTAVLVGALRGHANVLVLPGAGARTWMGLGRGIGLGALVGLASVEAWRWAGHRYQWARHLKSEFRELLGPLLPDEIFLLAATSSIGEEMLFRGALLPALPAGLWTSSLLFALPHVGPGARFVPLLPWTLSSLAAGLAFGWLMQATGDLAAPVTAHFLINFLNLSIITQRPR